jgi:hypothetical protein
MLSGVMTDVGNPPVPLLLHDWLIGAAPLQIVVANELHVHRFLSASHRLRLRNDAANARENTRGNP